MHVFITKRGDNELKQQLALQLQTSPGAITISADPDPYEQFPGNFHFEGRLYEYYTDNQGQLLPQTVTDTGQAVVQVRKK